jgi:hypothetical protein
MLSSKDYEDLADRIKDRKFEPPKEHILKRMVNKVLEFVFISVVLTIMCVALLCLAFTDVLKGKKNAERDSERDYDDDDWKRYW